MSTKEDAIQRLAEGMARILDESADWTITRDLNTVLGEALAEFAIEEGIVPVWDSATAIGYRKDPNIPWDAVCAEEK